MQRNRAKRFAQKESGRNGSVQKVKETNRFVQIGIAALALAFIAVGLGRQEHLDVMQKAIRICLECIGIG